MADSPKGSIFSSITPQQVLAILTLLSSTLLLQFQPLQSRREMDRATAAATGVDCRTARRARVRAEFIRGLLLVGEAPSRGLDRPGTATATGRQQGVGRVDLYQN